MGLPALKFTARPREYGEYDETLRAKMLYAYLFKGLSYREIDTEVLNFNRGGEGWTADTHGWQSKGVLGHLGVTRDHKKIFEEYSVAEARAIIKWEMKNLDDEERAGWEKILDSLKKL